jgi:DNA-binding HxlR family transcriptional regulator
LIARELLLRPRRYSELLEHLPGLTTNLLAKRLEEMAAHGLIERTTRDGHPAWTYTDLGARLEPVILELGRFGGAFLGQPQPEDTLDIAWALISLKRRYRPLSAPMTLGLVVDERTFTLRLAQTLVVQERAPQWPDAELRGPVAAFREWLFAGVKLSALRRAGRLEVEAGPGTLPRLRRAFTGVG